MSVSSPALAKQRPFVFFTGVPNLGMSDLPIAALDLVSGYGTRKMRTSSVLSPACTIDNVFGNRLCHLLSC
jgi:hypothetical protein